MFVGRQEAAAPGKRNASIMCLPALTAIVSPYGVARRTVPMRSGGRERDCAEDESVLMLVPNLASYTGCDKNMHLRRSEYTGDGELRLTAVTS
ncbi:hypothetical protein CALCODRAFT_84922 [Calocera cornea HHB12733]|uniref:Uncharacterized protein n=1 Tax=Calocera cornea HHB12733 TaxID=1353952 RepID=A0A165IN69_9BASI|nr:hypothetical protein CALCODRAFT_84922 [Calocera cornea HHB12733]